MTMFEGLILLVFMAVSLGGRAPWPDMMPTPPMAWNGWLPCVAIRHNRTESIYYEAADLLVSSGLRDAGYNLVYVTCNGWIRDAHGKIAVNTTLWPRGMNAYADYLHARGLKLGLYADTGPINCCGEPGQYGHEEDDMQAFVDMGADHISIDNCGNPFGFDHSREEYVRMLNAIVQVDHPVAIGVWAFGAGRPWVWGPDTGHYWRTGPDLGNKWAPDEEAYASVMFNYDLQQSIPGIADIAGPGGFNNLDNLAVGLPPNVPHKGDPGLTRVEQETHFSLWSIMNSALIICFDLKSATKDTVDLVSNPEVIAVNQDPLGRQAVRVDLGLASYRVVTHVSPPPHGVSEVLVKPLAGGDWAVVLFNRDMKQHDITLHFADLGDTTIHCLTVRDLWARSDLGAFNESFVGHSIPVHGCRMLRVRPCE